MKTYRKCLLVRIRQKISAACEGVSPLIAFSSLTWWSWFLILLSSRASRICSLSTTHSSLQGSNSSSWLASSCTYILRGGISWTTSAPDLIASWDNGIVMVDPVPVDEDWELGSISSFWEQENFWWNVWLGNTISVLRVDDLHDWSFATCGTCSICSSGITPCECLTCGLSLFPNILLKVFIWLEGFLAVLEDVWQDLAFPFLLNPVSTLLSNLVMLIWSSEWCISTKC